MTAKGKSFNIKIASPHARESDVGGHWREVHFRSALIVVIALEWRC